MKPVETTPYGRFYNVDGNWKPSVTTILKYGFPVSPGLLQWLKSQPSAEEADRIRDEAGERGSLTHSLIEKLLGTGAVDLEGLPEDVVKMVIGLNNYITDHVAEIIALELQLSDHQAAGRVDAVVKLKEDNKLAVIDFKTSKTISESYHVQVAKYVDMYCKANQLPLIAGQIIHLKPLTKKGYQVIDVDIVPSLLAFDYAYGIYKYLDLPMAPKERAPLPTNLKLILKKS